MLPVEKRKKPAFPLLWWRQFRLLMWKNWILAKRSKRALFLQIAAPIAFVLLLLIVDAVARANRNNRSDDSIVVKYSKYRTVGKIHRCQVGYDEDYCYTFVYSPTNNPIVETLIQGIMAENGIPANEVRGFDNSSLMDAWIYNNQNQTAGGYQFDISDVNGTTLISYNIVSNETNSRRFGVVCEYTYYTQLPMFVSLERQLLRYISSNNSLNLEVTTLDFPHPEVDVIDVISAAAPIFFFGAIMFNFVIAVSQIVTEKELRLRNSLNMMGLMDSVFWASWFCMHIIFSTGTVFLIIIFGAICQFDFILNNNFLTYFLALWFFALAMVSMAFLVSTLVKRAKNATAIGFLIFISGFLLQLTVQFLYEDGASIGNKIAQYIISIYAPVMLAKALKDIAGATSKQADTGLSASDIIDYTSTFPLIQVYVWLMVEFVIYFLVALYLDNVLPDARGARKPFYYFVLPSYWGSGIKAKAGEAATEAPDEDSMDPDVYKEEMAVRNDETAEDVVVKICGLNKTYPGARRGGWLGWFNKCSCRCCPTRVCGKKIPPFRAVDDIWFSINANQLFCLLGPNGAGKTTTISMLTGQLPPTKGDANLYGFSVLNQVPQIQQFMGVCPQFDVLWDDLTGKEHLMLFAGMKGLSWKRSRQEAKAKLEEVALTSAGNKVSRTYSGGMKRRLSVAMALIGDPKVVFLDEPTTGMDPVSRRQVWNIIEKAKKDRVIVLTTHSMEEADILGDRIAIMAFGKLRCIGSSIRLKTKYGTGYSITIGADPNNVKRIVEFFESSLDGAELESAPVSGYMTFDIPSHLMPELPNFLESLEANKEELGITDMQLSLTTLEEVFLRIVRDAEETQKEVGIQESKHLSDTFGIGAGSTVGVKRPSSGDL